jgi:hypothetical protein
MPNSSLNLDHLPSDKDISCYVLFYIDKKDNILFDLSWGEGIDDMKNIVYLLHAIKHTEVINSGLNSAMENCMSDPQQALDIYTVIQALAKMDRNKSYEKEQSEKPLIRPIDNK